MFKLSEIKELIKLIDQSTLQELEIENEGSRLLIRKPNKTESVFVSAAPVQHTYSSAIPAAVHAPQFNNPAPEAVTDIQNAVQKQAESTLHTIVSPMVGTFYQSSSPGTPHSLMSAPKSVKKR